MWQHLRTVRALFDVFASGSPGTFSPSFSSPICRTGKPSSPLMKTFLCGTKSLSLLPGSVQDTGIPAKIPVPPVPSLPLYICLSSFHGVYSDYPERYHAMMFSYPAILPLSVHSWAPPHMQPPIHAPAVSCTVRMAFSIHYRSGTVHHFILSITASRSSFFSLFRSLVRVRP